MKLRKLNEMYSTDGEFIYRYGEKRPEIDIKTFHLIGEKDGDCQIGLDKNFVYRFDGIIESADPNSFEYVDKCFFKDNATVYYSYHRLDQLDSKSMRILNGMYVGDRRYLYYCDFHNVKPPFLVEPKPNMQDIKVHGEWAFDKQFMYFAGELIPGVDCESINFFDEYGFFKDKSSVYYQGEQIEGADPITFRPVGNGYGKDKKNVYFFSRKVVNADVASFKAKGKVWGMGIDDQNTYHFGKEYQAPKAS